MVTLREQMEQIILVRLTAINGEETEMELNCMIAKQITDDKLKSKKAKNRIIGIEDYIKVYEKKDDIGSIVQNGAWVYVENSIEDWQFKRFDTIADAVRNAVTLINANIICNGEIIEYDALDKETAYYIDEKTDSARIVKL